MTRPRITGTLRPRYNSTQATLDTAHLVRRIREDREADDYRFAVRQAKHGIASRA